MRGPDPWATPDALGEALHFLRMTGAFYCRSELSEPWGLEMPRMDDCMWFHVVTDGRCRLDVDGAAIRYLVPGEFALVPHGLGHTLASDDHAGASAPVVYDLPHDYVSDRYAVIRHGGGGVSTTMICGAVRLDHPSAVHLIRSLPPLIVVESVPSPHLSWMHSTLGLVADEARTLRPGGEAVITRLSDILVIQALRSWIEHDPAARTGWLGALQDPGIGPALASLHRSPDTQWTVASLAASVTMSRSAFAARFTALVGETPMKYLARWRMQVAHDLLRSGDVTVAELAKRSGYDSDAAFARAFKRVIGVPPGSVRRRVETTSIF
ncbi:AraC family transcriptional regulator [Rhodococcus sp. B10]|uniref:AraC family transcriptional regulator n=1 Tax=Rhodococcus sp. B10 TaxID=2695876 RepID=UPI001430A358|nr:AraC family transcriptional regulator [Rhodococcus sp. B10]NIL74576.1 RCS-specific HTH-type transcriptional activator RclR [Rhodococcus sp. B10]